MRYATLALVALFVTGCNMVKAPIEGRQDPYTPAQIHFASKKLRSDTAVRAPVLSRENGLLRVDVPIRSATNHTLYVDYRVSFFDDRGQQLYQTGWMTKTLPPNTPDQISVVSSTEQAADFQMDLRYAQ